VAVTRAWVETQQSVVVAVAGVKAMDVDLTRIKEGYEVELRAEPTNPHDPNAIQVIGWYGNVRKTEGHLLGYVPRDWAAALTAEDWTATVLHVLSFEGKPAGLRLLLKRKQDESLMAPPELPESEFFPMARAEVS
jgi:hypothetical protein